MAISGTAPTGTGEGPPKYFSNAAGDVGAMGSSGCGNLAPSGGWINDINAQGCWAVRGPTIYIGWTWVSLQAACEIINAAFSSVSQQPGLSNSVYLQGNMELTRG